jgi:hypothetical protein
VKALLTDIDVTTERRPGRPARVRTANDAAHLNPEKSARKSKRRTMSAEGRAKIAEAQRLRWEKTRKATKKAARAAASLPVKKVVTTETGGHKTVQVKNGVAVKKSVQS